MHTFNKKGDSSVFKVPDNYFENFNKGLGSVIDNVEAKKRKEKKHYLISHMRPYIYAAAILVFAFFAATTILNKNKTENRTISDNTTETTVEDYLINTIGTYEISQYYIDENLKISEK